MGSSIFHRSDIYQLFEPTLRMESIPAVYNDNQICPLCVMYPLGTSTVWLVLELLCWGVSAGMKDWVIDIHSFECDYWGSQLLQNAWNITIESERWFVLWNCRRAWMGWTHFYSKRCVLLQQFSALQPILFVVHHHPSGLLPALWKWRGCDRAVFEGLSLSGVHSRRLLGFSSHPERGGESSPQTEAVRCGRALFHPLPNCCNREYVPYWGLSSARIHFDWLWVLHSLFCIGVEGWHIER